MRPLFVVLLLAGLAGFVPDAGAQGPVVTWLALGERVSTAPPDQIEPEPESVPVESEQADAAAAEAEVPIDPQAGSEEDGHGE